MNTNTLVAAYELHIRVNVQPLFAEGITFDNFNCDNALQSDNGQKNKGKRGGRRYQELVNNNQLPPRSKSRMVLVSWVGPFRANQPEDAQHHHL